MDGRRKQAAQTQRRLKRFVDGWRNAGEVAHLPSASWLGFAVEVKGCAGLGKQCLPMRHAIVPARIPAPLAAQACKAALTIAEALFYQGVLCVEFFVEAAGTLLVNEFAPRPHNSGHGTLDASRTSQFEQQVRTLAGLPLGDTTMGTPVVMQNLLGDLWNRGMPHWQVLLADPAATLHLYGKAEPRRGRKMGHFTCVAPTVDEAIDAALRLRRLLPACGHGERSSGISTTT